MLVMTLSASPVQTFEEPRQKIRIEWLELTCLPCGEVAGFIEDGRLVRPVFPGGIRLVRGQPRCGRCNALLFGGERGVATSRESIG
jgi:hypothetical protein